MKDGLPVNSISDALQDRAGYIWAATFDGLARFDGVRFTVFNTSNSPGLPSDRIISLKEGRELLPFLCSFGLFFLAFTGLVISLWPFIAPPSVTLWDAAVEPKAQAFLMLGTLFLLPVILLYVAWSYWVFRGKVTGAHGYHAT